MIERKYHIESGVGTNGMLDYLMAVKHDARATTIRYLKDIDQQELDWVPYEGWNSIAALLMHIICGDRYFRIWIIEARELTEKEKEELIPGLELGKYAKEFKDKPVEYYLKELEASYAESREALSKIPAEKLLERRYDGYDTLNGANMAWILYHDAEDEVHHRGQISILRKLYKTVGDIK